MTDYQEIFENIPDGVTLHDAEDGSILATNQQFCEMLGYTREELLATDFDDLHVDEPPYTSDRAQQYLRQAATEGPQTFEWMDETKTGDRLPVEVHLRNTTIDDADRILAVVRDISERKQREQALETERDRANALFEHLGEPVVEVTFEDDNAIVEAINTAFAETFGTEESEIVGESLDAAIVPTGNRDRAMELNRRTLDGSVTQEEIQRSTPDGLRTFLLRTVPYSLEGETRAFGVYLDITDRKRQEERFQAFIQQSTDIISVLDPDGTYQYLSPSIERIAGYTPEELIGDIGFDYVHPEDREDVVEAFADAVEDPELVPTAEFRFQHKDGSWIWFESIGNNQLDNPAIEGFVVNSREITERKANEQALERQNERLEEFASVISHDLRNPLNVAQGRAELAAEECESEHLEKVQAAHERMDALIEDVLTLSRAGAPIGELESVALAEMVAASWSNVTAEAADLEVATDQVIRADPSRLLQVFENLFRNAVEHGGADVTVEVGALANGFYVEDDGVGIPAEVRDEVFEAGVTTTAEGTGFGLSIVERIADGHGWSVAVGSSEDGGARFEFTDVTVE